MFYSFIKYLVWKYSFSANNLFWNLFNWIFLRSNNTMNLAKFLFLCCVFMSKLVLSLVPRSQKILFMFYDKCVWVLLLAFNWSLWSTKRCVLYSDSHLLLTCECSDVVAFSEEIKRVSLIFSPIELLCNLVFYLKKIIGHICIVYVLIFFCCFSLILNLSLLHPLHA